jgi:hypothetical protein
LLTEAELAKEGSILFVEPLCCSFINNEVVQKHGCFDDISSLNNVKLELSPEYASP